MTINKTITAMGEAILESAHRPKNQNIIKGKDLDQNVLVKPDDTIIVP